MTWRATRAVGVCFALGACAQGGGDDETSAADAAGGAVDASAFADARPVPDGPPLPPTIDASVGTGVDAAVPFDAPVPADAGPGPDAVPTAMCNDSVCNVFAGECVLCPGDCTFVPECGLGTCDHDVCTLGTPLNPVCSACSDAVCDVSPYCCIVEWDDICLDLVDMYCDPGTCPT